MPEHNTYPLSGKPPEDAGYPIYLLAAGAVSPQPSFGQMFVEPAGYTGDKFSCIEPDYTRYIDAKLIRRMSRIIKMGVAAASDALRETDIQMPDAIITGTAYGCLADTDQFLTRMTEFNETLLSPTAFIQSTHNTVAAQIALMLQCHGYNNTYVHRGSSFESALTDAISLMEEGDAQTVLLGAADEITEKSHTILKRFGLYKKNGNSRLLMEGDSKGSMAGEGAAFFVLSNKAKEAIARLDAFHHFYKPGEDMEGLIKDFLSERKISANDIDLVITGFNGDIREKSHYDAVNEEVFPHNKMITYKQYCGEYPTSVAFAWWMATHILQAGEFNGNPVKQVLIYNNYMLQYPSLYLLSAC